MKVLMINKFLYPNGGSETYMFELGKQLERMGHEVQYFGWSMRDAVWATGWMPTPAAWISTAAAS